MTDSHDGLDEEREQEALFGPEEKKPEVELDGLDVLAQASIDELRIRIEHLQEMIRICRCSDDEKRSLLGSLQKVGKAATAALKWNREQARVNSPPSSFENVRLLSVEVIQDAVCDYFQLTREILLGSDRHRTPSLARALAMYFCRRFLRYSYPEIARGFAHRDHTTIMSAVRRIEGLIVDDPRVAKYVEDLRARLEAAAKKIETPQVVARESLYVCAECHRPAPKETPCPNCGARPT